MSTRRENEVQKSRRNNGKITINLNMSVCELLGEWGFFSFLRHTTKQVNNIFSAFKTIFGLFIKQRLNNIGATVTSKTYSLEHSFTFHGGVRWRMRRELLGNEGEVCKVKGISVK